jgi:tetratricopeptide (TPR) repeat protein
MTPSFDSFMEQGLAASRRDEAECAVQAWQAAAAADPCSALPHFLMGAEYAQSGRLADAEAAFANAVILAPQFDTARYQLGLLQFTSGRAAVAQVTWEPLFNLATDHPVRCFVDGFTALARDEFETALRSFQSGIAANRSNPPMNADIARVMDAIRRLLGSGSQEPAFADDAHVLLAAYRQQGTTAH